MYVASVVGVQGMDRVSSATERVFFSFSDSW
jgi:hypothetical protein